MQSRLVASIVVFMALGAAFAQDPHQRVESLVGSLKGASYFDSHDGKPSWAAFVVAKRGTYLVTGGGDDYVKFKKLTGKRVVAKGMISVEMRDPDGKVVKLGGKLAGIEYVGILAVSKIEDVAVQEPVELEGVVEEIETPDPKDQKRKVKSLRLVATKPEAKTYVCGSEAKKKLSARAGKVVKIRCFLDDATIDAIVSIAD